VNFFEDSLQYLMNDMLVNAYDFKSIKDTVKKLTERLPTVPYELNFILIATPPTVESELINRFSDEGKLKSFQKKEICVKIKDVVKGALNNYLESSLNRFSRAKNSSTIKVKNNANEFRVLICVRNLEKFSADLIYAVLNHFNVDALGYCDEVKVILSVAQTKGSPLEVVLKESLPKVTVSTHSKFFTLNDKDTVLEFFGCPEVKDVLFTHFFPQGLDKDQVRTEITYDALREETVAQKRRNVLLPSGEYENLHDAITPYTTHEDFLQIIEINDILGFYPSVRTTKANGLVTAMIDVDVSSFLRTAFSPTVVWNLVIALTEEIMKNLTEFLLLPTPLIAFSGSRGVHITYRLDPECVNADFNYVDYSELYLLPSQKSLAKNSKSLIHSKFAFVKTLMQAILLYTAQNISRDKIPKIIREQLGIVRIMDLFTLSVFSRNKIGVLLDTSSNNSSVYRVFSIHPTTGLVSIPLLDPNTKKIRTELKDFTQLKQECKPETVVNNLRAGSKDLYAQFPPEISKQQIKYLLRPDKLLPTLSVIVRFSDRWATERSPWSMKFWLEMYQLNNFYDYLLAKMISIERSDKQIGSSYQEVVGLVENSVLSTKSFVREALDDYFFRNLSFKALKAQLDAYHDLNFYASFKFTEIAVLTPERIDNLYSDLRSRKMFFRKFTSFFNVAIVFLTHCSRDNSKIDPSVTKSLVVLWKKANRLSEELKTLKLEDEKNRTVLVKKSFVQICCMYNLLSKFIKELIERAKLQ
jgi:hypothetical protein